MACVTGAKAEELYVRLTLVHLGEGCPQQPQCADCTELIRALNALAAECEARGCRLDRCVYDAMA